MHRPAGSEGIYFIVRLPTGWELVPFRFDEHTDGGHPEFWEAHLTSLLARKWAPELFRNLNAVELRRCELRLQGELDLHYDGFPRGRVTRIDDPDRFVIYHGNNLKPAMKVARRAVERAFGIKKRVDWRFDDHEQCTAFSAEGIRSALRLRDRWKTVTEESA